MADSRRPILALLVAMAVVVPMVVFSAGLVSGEDPPNTYTGCLLRGDLTNVDVGELPAGRCKRDATLVSWNEQGPQGNQGPQGRQGEPGIVPDATCPAGQYVTGVSGGELVCNAITHMQAGGYSVDVSETDGVVIQTQNGNAITVDDQKVAVDSFTVDIDGTSVDVASTTILDLHGGFIYLNGCNRWLSGIFDTVTGWVIAPFGGGQVYLEAGQIVTGSLTVCSS